MFVLWMVMAVPLAAGGSCEGKCGYGTKCEGWTCVCLNSYGKVVNQDDHLIFCLDTCTANDSKCPENTTCEADVRANTHMCQCSQGFKRSKYGQCLANTTVEISEGNATASPDPTQYTANATVEISEGNGTASPDPTQSTSSNETWSSDTTVITQTTETSTMLTGDAQRRILPMVAGTAGAAFFIVTLLVVVVVCYRRREHRERCKTTLSELCVQESTKTGSNTSTSCEYDYINDRQFLTAGDACPSYDQVDLPTFSEREHTKSGLNTVTIETPVDETEELWAENDLYASHRDSCGIVEETTPVVVRNQNKDYTFHTHAQKSEIMGSDEESAYNRLHKSDLKSGGMEDTDVKKRLFLNTKLSQITDVENDTSYNVLHLPTAKEESNRNTNILGFNMSAQVVSSGGVSAPYEEVDLPTFAQTKHVKCGLNTATVEAPIGDTTELWVENDLYAGHKNIRPVDETVSSLQSSVMMGNRNKDYILDAHAQKSEIVGNDEENAYNHLRMSELKSSAMESANINEEFFQKKNQNSDLDDDTSYNMLQLPTVKEKKNSQSSAENHAQNIYNSLYELDEVSPSVYENNEDICLSSGFGGSPGADSSEQRTVNDRISLASGRRGDKCTPLETTGAELEYDELEF